MWSASRWDDDSFYQPGSGATSSGSNSSTGTGAMGDCSWIFSSPPTRDSTYTITGDESTGMTWTLNSSTTTTPHSLFTTGPDGSVNESNSTTICSVGRLGHRWIRRPDLYLCLYRYRRFLFQLHSDDFQRRREIDSYDHLDESVHAEGLGQLRTVGPLARLLLADVRLQQRHVDSTTTLPDRIVTMSTQSNSHSQTKRLGQPRSGRRDEPVQPGRRRRPATTSTPSTLKADRPARRMPFMSMMNHNTTCTPPVATVPAPGRRTESPRSHRASRA